MAFCPKCGSKVDDDADFCVSCGTSLNQKSEEIKKDVENDRLLLIPLILGIIGIITGIIEGLSCPVLFGWDFILLEMCIAIIGGLLGIYLFKCKEECLLAGVEFILTGLIMVFSIYNMAIIGCVIFVAAGVSSIFVGKHLSIANKVLTLIPVLTVVLPILLLVIMGGVGMIAESNLSNQVSISNVENSISYSYGYYSGSLEGNIHLGTDFDYIEMDIEYYDEHDTIIYSGLVWNELNAQSGKTYHFDSTYVDEKQPVKAQITLKNSAADDNSFYIQNVTLV